LGKNEMRTFAILVLLTVVVGARAVSSDFWLTLRYDVLMQFGCSREKNMVPPTPIEVRAPTFPSSMMIEEITGEVVADFTVSSEGIVRELVFITFSDEAFKAAVRDAAQGWKFKPGSSSNRVRCKIQFAIYENGEPNQAPQPNAGSHSTSGDSSVSETPSSLGRRG
jgi:hypothetical protein